MRRLSLPRGPLIALDAHGGAHHRRIRTAPDGGVRVTDARAAAQPGNHAYVLALSPALLYRRRVPALPGSRRQLRLVAQDLFPFDPDETRYAATPGPDGGTCWALKAETYARLTEGLPAPAAVVVASPEPGDLTRAVNGRLASAVADLLDRPAFMIRPAPVVTAGLVALALVLTGVGYERWQGAREAQLQALEAELDRLQTETADVRDKRAALVRMNAARSALGALAERPGVQAVARLYALLEAMPAQARVDEITFADGELRVSGLSNDAARWAEAAGVAAQRLEIATRPRVDRFTFRIPVAGDREAGS